MPRHGGTTTHCARGKRRTYTSWGWGLEGHMAEPTAQATEPTQEPTATTEPQERTFTQDGQLRPGLSAYPRAQVVPGCD